MDAFEGYAKTLTVWVNGKQYTDIAADPDSTLLAWLRSEGEGVLVPLSFVFTHLQHTYDTP